VWRCLKNLRLESTSDGCKIVRSVNRPTELVPEWSPTEIVQMVLIGCRSRSRGQKIGFQNAIFKNLLSDTTRHIAFIFGI